MGQSVPGAASDTTASDRRFSSCRYFATLLPHSTHESACRCASRTADGESSAIFCPVSSEEGTSASSSLLSRCLSNGRPNFRHSSLSYTSSGGTLLFRYCVCAGRICTAANDLVPNRLLHSFNYATDSLGTQSDPRQRRNLARAHSLPEIEPEDRPVTLPVWARQATLQMVIDLTPEKLEGYSLLAPMHLRARPRLDVAGGTVELVPSR